MVCKWSHWPSYVVAGLLLTALTGCGPLIIRSNPDTFAVPAEAASQLRGQQNVTLKNAYTAETQVRILTGPVDWSGDLKQYTETAIILLGREMAKKGITVAAQATKSITLRVHDVQCSAGWVIKCDLVLEAQYGDGAKSAIITHNVSPATAWRAVDGAIMMAVSHLLRDEQFLAYVNQ